MQTLRDGQSVKIVGNQSTLVGNYLHTWYLCTYMTATRASPLRICKGAKGEWVGRIYRRLMSSCKPMTVLSDWLVLAVKSYLQSKVSIVAAHTNTDIANDKPWVLVRDKELEK